MSADPPLAAVPGCKSATQRALLLAALAEGESRIAGPGEGADSLQLRAALAALGAESAQEGPAAWQVRGLGGLPQPAGRRLDCGEGGSTLRFLLALAAAAEGETELRAAEGLRARPHQAQLDTLRALGAEVEALADGWRVRGRGYCAREAEVAVDLSSQPLSGFLMASGAKPQRWTFRGAPASPGYLAMTIAMQRVVRGADTVTVEEGAIQTAPGFGRARDLTVPGDASAVLALACAALVAARPLALSRRWSERHPDASALAALQRAGLLAVDDADHGGVVLRPGTHALDDARPDRPEPLAGAPDAPALEFDLADAPDAGPVLAALALHLPGGALLHGSARLRVKESDREAGIRRLAEAAGARTALREGTLRVHAAAGAPRGERRFAAAGDHRMAMAAGIAALRDRGLRVEDPDCVAKSFPGFWDQLALLA